MIKNEKQYRITKSKKNEFIKSLELLKSSENDDLLNEIMINSLQSQIETFELELSEYETLKNKKPQILKFKFEQLPESLIKARIIRGISQSELAQKAGLKEQQIQRYESTNYETASFPKILEIAKCLDICFETSKLTFQTKELKVTGYDPLLIRKATSRLRSRKSLLKV